MKKQNCENVTCYKKQSLINIKKAQSLLTKIMKMIEEDKYCVDIMQQNLAVVGLLKAANTKIMEGHLNTCFFDALKSGDGDAQAKKIEEILQVIKLSKK